MREAVLDDFRQLNQDLETDGIIPLDGALNEWERYTYQYLIMTLVQERLDEWQRMYMRHTLTIKGEANATPMQLWYRRGGNDRKMAPHNEDYFEEAIPEVDRQLPPYGWARDDANVEIGPDDMEEESDEDEEVDQHLDYPPEDGIVRPIRQVPFLTHAERIAFEDACPPLSLAEIEDMDGTLRERLRERFPEKYNHIIDAVIPYIQNLRDGEGQNDGN